MFSCSGIGAADSFRAYLMEGVLRDNNVDVGGVRKNIFDCSRSPFGFTRGRVNTCFLQRLADIAQTSAGEVQGINLLYISCKLVSDEFIAVITAYTITSFHVSVHKSTSKIKIPGSQNLLPGVDCCVEICK